MAIPFGQLQNFGTGSNPDWFGQFGGQVATTGQGINESPYPQGSVPLGGSYDPAGGGTPPTAQQAADYAAQTAAQGFPAGSQPTGASQQTGGDPWSSFESILGVQQGGSLSPQMLLAKEAELKAAGITLIKNAAGLPGKVQFANGAAYDVIQGAGSGQNIYQRLPLNAAAGGTDGGGQPGGAGGFGSLNFNSPYQTFNGLSLADFQGSPGYEFAKQEGLKAIERNAASRGTLNTGGTQKAEIGYATGLASQDYANAWNRAFQGNQANFGNALQTNQTNYGNLYNLASLGQKSAAG